MTGVFLLAASVVTEVTAWRCGSEADDAEASHDEFSGAIYRQPRATSEGRRGIDRASCSQVAAGRGSAEAASDPGPTQEA